MPVTQPTVRGGSASHGWSSAIEQYNQKAAVPDILKTGVSEFST
jgi:hypothetical protein